VYASGRKLGTDVFRLSRRRHPHDESWPGCWLLARRRVRLVFLPMPTAVSAACAPR